VFLAFGINRVEHHNAQTRDGDGEGEGEVRHRPLGLGVGGITIVGGDCARAATIGVEASWRRRPVGVAECSDGVETLVVLSATGSATFGIGLGLEEWGLWRQ
jgi:hypothetical protein